MADFANVRIAARSRHVTLAAEQFAVDGICFTRKLQLDQIPENGTILPAPNCNSMRNDPYAQLAIGMTIGVGIGAALGAALGSLEMGLPVGVALGASVSAMFFHHN